MNEELQRKLLGWLDNIVSIAGAELPDIAIEYVTWGLWSGLLLFALFGIAASLCVFLAWRFYQLIDGSFDDNTPLCVFFCAFACACFVISGCNLHKAVKAHVAPKVYLIDRLRK